MNYQLSTNDMTKVVTMVSEQDNASTRFQRLVDKCLKDGTISDSEAVMLVQKHNDMQAKSRLALGKLLTHHRQGKHAAMLKNKRIHIIGDLQTNDPLSPYRGRMSKNLTPDVQNLDTDLYKETLKDKLVSPFGDDRVKFLAITGPSALFALLKLLGVI